MAKSVNSEIPLRVVMCCPYGFCRRTFVSSEDVVAQNVSWMFSSKLLFFDLRMFCLLKYLHIQIVVQKGSKRGVHFRRAGPRERVRFLL